MTMQNFFIKQMSGGVSTKNFRSISLLSLVILVLQYDLVVGSVITLPSHQCPICYTGLYEPKWVAQEGECTTSPGTTWQTFYREKEEECPMCHQPLEPDQAVVRFASACRGQSCHHRFHNGCIAETRRKRIEKEAAQRRGDILGVLAVTVTLAIVAALGA